MKEEAFLKTYYNQLNIIKTDLFQSILNSVASERKLEEIRLNKRTLETTLFHYMKKNEIPKVEYLPSENMVFIPEILLSKTFIEGKSPR